MAAPVKVTREDYTARELRQKAAEMWLWIAGVSAR